MNKWKTHPETVVDLTGRTIIITGANAGLGFESAKKFYAMNPARLILAVRTVSKGEAAKKRLVEEGGKAAPHGTVRGETSVEVWEVDMASFESVRSFAKKCEAELERVDVLVANAGVYGMGWTVTKDGWETDLQTNLLSTFLLAGLMAPLLARAATLPQPVEGVTLKPHLVFSVSDTHYYAPLRASNKSNILEALNDEAQYVQADRYPDTKLMEILMAQELAKNSLLNDVVVCSVNPGFCRTELLNDMPNAFRNFLDFIIGVPVEKGARTYMWASLHNDIPPGAYTSGCRVANTRGVTRSKDVDRIKAQLWKEMSAILVKVAPETEVIWKV
ncbi:hypothetical protein M408DRAFT_332403 [Serendipita vermifera MAFF 305830]|uniref:Ketoreductase (KR) domain-containing protein n=1 Tax=Serendipita vermifera MAFF 305830 TaxID=933852 RepID=A0A0C2WA44_SERVB|nr:hypothetical protein M408DRAFT_332403 [Serendipita vermifera MAFF 305830]